MSILADIAPLVVKSFMAMACLFNHDYCPPEEKGAYLVSVSGNEYLIPKEYLSWDEDKKNKEQDTVSIAQIKYPEMTLATREDRKFAKKSDKNTLIKIIITSRGLGGGVREKYLIEDECIFRKKEKISLAN